VFYVLSKIFDLLSAPLTWGIVGLGVAVWGVLRARRRVALGGLVASAVVLYTFSIDDVSRSLLRYGEGAAPSTIDRSATYDAVVVLGGFAGAEPRDALGEPTFSEAVERMLATYTLLRDGRARQVLVSAGGSKRPVEAEAVVEQLVAWGIDPSRIVADLASRNTHENAVESARIIREHGWSRLVLITSALHMPRAAGCFKEAGLTFDTLSVDFRSAAGPEETERFLPRAAALAESTDVLRELAGRVVYRARGYAVAYP
jgi:uncharacterized SAM-binding protein YcdF (DUF218 family)